MTTRPGPVVACLALLVALPMLAGCPLARYAIDAVAPDNDTTVFNARYTGLPGQRVAVIVAADETTRYRYPEAADAIRSAVTQHLAGNLDNITLVDSAAVGVFERHNPYWITQPASRLLEQFNVDRLVVVDLSTYRTREPGNAVEWRGQVDAVVSVYAADAADPDDRVFHAPVQGRFPATRSAGLTDGDERTIQFGMVTDFADRAAGLFYERQR